MQRQRGNSKTVGPVGWGRRWIEWVEADPGTNRKALLRNQVSIRNRTHLLSTLCILQQSSTIPPTHTDLHFRTPCYKIMCTPHYLAISYHLSTTGKCYHIDHSILSRMGSIRHILPRTGTTMMNTTLHMNRCPSEDLLCRWSNNRRSRSHKGDQSNDRRARDRCRWWRLWWWGWWKVGSCRGEKWSGRLSLIWWACTKKLCFHWMWCFCYCMIAARTISGSRDSWLGSHLAGSHHSTQALWFVWLTHNYWAGWLWWTVSWFSKSPILIRTDKSPELHNLFHHTNSPYVILVLHYLPIMIPYLFS